MSGIIGKKVGMTQVFEADGKMTPVTVIEAGPCFVTQIKTMENDGYIAVQLAFDDKKDKNTTAALQGHFKKATVTSKRKVVEFDGFDTNSLKLGDAINVDFFNDVEFVDIVGVTKGKGFQGVVKRHGFAGIGDSTHGQHDRGRAPGSLGGSSYPARVFKGLRMAGRMGGVNRKARGIKVVKVILENNILLVKGSVPGANGSYLIIEK